MGWQVKIKQEAILEVDNKEKATSDKIENHINRKQTMSEVIRNHDQIRNRVQDMEKHSKRDT